MFASKVEFKKYLDEESMNLFVNPMCKLSDNSFSIFCVFSCQ